MAHYGIYIDYKFIDLYAITAEEAHKYCAQYVQKKIQEYKDTYGSVVHTEPLWAGQHMKEDGYYILYELPVESGSKHTTTMYIVKRTTLNGWFKSSVQIDTLHTIQRITMQRVNTAVTGKKLLEQTHEIVKSDIFPGKVRNLNRPHDRLLHEIEKKTIKNPFDEVNYAA